MSVSLRRLGVCWLRCTSRCGARGAQENWIIWVMACIFLRPLVSGSHLFELLPEEYRVASFREMTPGMVSVFSTLLGATADTCSASVYEAFFFLARAPAALVAEARAADRAHGPCRDFPPLLSTVSAKVQGGVGGKARAARRPTGTEHGKDRCVQVPAVSRRTCGWCLSSILRQSGGYCRSSSETGR